MARNKSRATPSDCLPMNPSTDDQAVYNTISPAMLLGGMNSLAIWGLMLSTALAVLIDVSAMSGGA
ncbi:MAG: hypothetical protein ABIK08_04635 [Pseudomonadota bacterium]